MITNKILKKCTKCGVAREYKPRIRHCREQKFGNASYWCYGKLVAVVFPKAEQPSKPVKRPQDTAKAKLVRTEKALDKVNAEVFALAKRLGVLSGRARSLSAWASRYAALASLSDAEVEAQRQKRLEQKAARALKTRTRAIDLE